MTKLYPMEVGRWLGVRILASFYTPMPTPMYMKVNSKQHYLTLRPKLKPRRPK